MSLISRIDALPIRAKVLCGTFAYGRTEEPEELGANIAVRVGADVYRYEIPYWYLAVWNTDTPWAFEPESGDWEEVGTFAREEDFLGVFAEHVGDKVWRGGKYM